MIRGLRTVLLAATFAAACSGDASLLDGDAPDAVLRLLDAQGTELPSGRVPHGAPFSFDGSRSVGGSGAAIARYAWLLPATGTVVETTAPTVPGNALFGGTYPAPGSYTVVLSVHDAAGRESRLARVTLVVTEVRPPTAVLRMSGNSGSSIPWGSGFDLDGSASVAAGRGSIVKYVWSLSTTGITVETDIPTLNGRQLFDYALPPPGVHPLRLVVIDDSGNESAPAQLDLHVIDMEAPSAVLHVLDADGARVVNARVPHGAEFSFDGSWSSDGASDIARYMWIRLDTEASIETTLPTLAGTALFDGVAPAPGAYPIGLLVFDESDNESPLSMVTLVVFDPDDAAIRTSDAHRH